MYHGHGYAFAHQVSIALVCRIYTDSGIAQYGLRTGGGHGHVLVALLHPVAHEIELALLFAIQHFLVRNCSARLRVPVDHPYPPVYPALAVQVDKHFDHASVTELVHGEAGAVPVAGGPKLLELFKDDASVFFLPFPGVAEEFLPAELGFPQAALAQHGHHPGFCCDGGVIGTRHPAGLEALHPLFAYQHILNGVVEHMAHVQHTRHIGRGDHDGVGFFVRVRGRAEEAVLHPDIVPLMLDFSRLVF